MRNFIHILPLGKSPVFKKAPKIRLNLWHAFIFFLVVLAATSCKKESMVEEVPVSTYETPEEIAAVATNTFKVVGTGSGRLNLGTIANIKLKIKAGTYSNISYDKATNVVIDATGVKLPGGSVDIANSNNVEFYGFSVTNSRFRAVNIRGLNTALNLHHLNFQNIGDYVITFEYNGVYDGTEKTLNNNSRITNCVFDNVSSAINFNSGIDKAQGIKGMVSNFKLLSNTFKNSPTMGTAMYSGITENVEIAYNVIDNVNTKNKNHNGIFSITGNGSLHGNRCTNHQGNLVRFWGVSVGSARKKILIYDNMVWYSLKYSAFELQVPPYLKEIIQGRAGKLTYTDAEVYSNSAGELNNSKDWEGQMLDLYNTYGAVKYYNNLGFQMNRVINGVTKYQGITNMINFNGSGTSFVEYGNRYFMTKNLAWAFKLANLSIGSSIMH